MAKVTYPLLSGQARGRIGQMIVFYGDGKVRGWSTQRDPQTASQTQSRIVVAEVMTRIKLSAGLDRAWLRTVLGKSWHLKIAAWLTRNGLANASASLDVWNGFTQGQRDSWESIA